MTNTVHRGSFAPAQPSWLRALALFCLLLVAGTSTAQAAHIHGEWLPHSAKHASLPAAASQGTGEEHCQLCVAMHTVLPATLELAYAPVLKLAQGFAARAARASERRWSFALFCRPPPALLSDSTAG